MAVGRATFYTFFEMLRGLDSCPLDVFGGTDVDEIEEIEKFEAFW